MKKLEQKFNEVWPNIDLHPRAQEYEANLHYKV